MSGERQDIERRIADAIEDWRDGTLSDSQLEEIRSLLVSSPQARKAYLEHNQLSGILDSVEWTPEISHAAATSVDDAPMLNSGPRRGVRPGIAYAGWLTAAVALVLWINKLAPDREADKIAANPNDVSEQAFAPSELPAAVVVHQIDARWHADAVRATGEAVEQGWLRLSAGIVQLEFSSGAQLALQGPAQLRVDSDMECFLQSGKLTVLAPPEASQFTVKSPSGNVIDLGTEFGIVVDEDGQMDVHVLDGEVEVEIENRHKRRLVEDQAATIDPNTMRIEDTAMNRGAFDPIRHETLVATKPLKLQFDCGIRAGVYQGAESPGHASGDLTVNEIYWNGVAGNQSGHFVMSDGSVCRTPLDITMAHSRSRRVDWDFGSQLNYSSQCVTQGVFNTALGRDCISSGGTLGMRIQGLPVGKYRVYFIARAVDDSRRGNYRVLKAYRVAVGTNIDELPNEAALIAPLDDPDARQWVEGQTHYEGEVKLFAPGDSLAMIVRRDPAESPQTGGGGTPILGVQIVQID